MTELNDCHSCSAIAEVDPRVHLCEPCFSKYPACLLQAFAGPKDQVMFWAKLRTEDAPYQFTHASVKGAWLFLQQIEHEEFPNWSVDGACRGVYVRFADVVWVTGGSR